MNAGGQHGGSAGYNGSVPLANYASGQAYGIQVYMPDNIAH